MGKSLPTRAETAAQLQALSRTKGTPVTAREYQKYPERLCSVWSITATIFRQPWNGVLTACGIRVRDYCSPEQIVDYALDFYHREGRWPKARDYKKPCSHWVVCQVFRGAENAVAEVDRRAQRTLAALMADGMSPAEYLAEQFISAPPRPRRAAWGPRRPGAWLRRA
jgi:hypothetical protein